MALKTCRVCGLKAYNEEGLEAFVAHSGRSYGCANICKKCQSNHNKQYRLKNLEKIRLREKTKYYSRTNRKIPPKKQYLRKCTICGLKAHTKKDLENFIKNDRYKHNTKNMCKQCGSNKDKKYRDKNKEKILERNKRYQSKNKEKNKEWGKTGYFRNSGGWSRFLFGKPHTHGENHWWWKGGVFVKSYGTDWTNELQEEIRSRDKHKCQHCQTHQNDILRKLPVHHIIPYRISKDNTPTNLISLCGKCHGKIEQKWEKWVTHLQKKIKTNNNRKQPITM